MLYIPHVSHRQPPILCALDRPRVFEKYLQIKSTEMKSKYRKSVSLKLIKNRNQSNSLNMGIAVDRNAPVKNANLARSMFEVLDKI